MDLTVLLVDDEALQLNLLRQVVASLRPTYRISATNKADAALKMLNEQHFDILITDIKMPRMDGLTLVGKVRDMGLANLKIVILSGFDDFSYAQQAIRYGVSDYLLKPISGASIQATFEQLERKIAEPESRKNGGGQQALEWLLSKKMLGLPLSKDEQYSIECWQKEDAVLALALVQWRGRQPAPACFSSLCKGNKLALSFPIQQWGQLVVYPLSSAFSAKLLEQQLKDTLSDSAVWAMHTHVVLHSVAAAYKQLQTLAESAIFLETSGLIYQECEDIGTSELLEALSAPTETVLRRAGYSLRYGLATGGWSVAACKRKFQYAVEQLVEKNKQLFHNEQLAKKQAEEWKTRMEASVSLGQAVELLCLAWRQLSGMQTQEDSFRANCLLYIKNHFAHEITLSRMADHFHYNPSYFSHRFTQTFHFSFSKMLTKYRMEQASALLTNTDMPVAEVGRQVGISDSGYFNKLFRETYGMTPKRYRQYHRTVEA